MSSEGCTITTMRRGVLALASLAIMLVMLRLNRSERLLKVRQGGRGSQRILSSGAGFGAKRAVSRSMDICAERGTRTIVEAEVTASIRTRILARRRAKDTALGVVGTAVSDRRKEIIKTSDKSRFWRAGSCKGVRLESKLRKNIGKHGGLSRDFSHRTFRPNRGFNNRR